MIKKALHDVHKREDLLENMKERLAERQRIIDKQKSGQKNIMMENKKNVNIFNET